MAQDGDTITYTFSDGTSVAEDVSSVDEAVVDYMDGTGVRDPIQDPAASGGRVENVTVDVSSESTLYIWVAGGTNAKGRYLGGASGDNPGGGSTEIAFTDTDGSNSDDEPFLVGAGGAANTAGAVAGGGGARGGNTAAGTFGDASDANGTPPPAGGDSGGNKDGDGAIASRSVVSGGTTIEGGGSEGAIISEDAEFGEVRISYKKTLSPPDPPSNLSAEVQ